MDVLISGPHTGLMNEAPEPAEWPAWWSWPWRMMSAWASPPASFAPQMLSQPILPGWLLGNSISVTEENSSSPETERHIVAAHSYGQQLGRILDVVNELVAERPAEAPDVQCIRDFLKLRDGIEEIKVQSAARRIEQAISNLGQIKQQNPDEYQRLAAKLWDILEDQPGAVGAESPPSAST